ncbi:tripartite tricarboxylate transporter TctB family protein [Oceanispirochaeta crateris]|uniref:Tripartite tricarboxylate transporter TctB family protein n=1 Tax=Oceanispirochaeta crateris TaxID=2518645 RepID=A0A5C1QUD9_9SPIO|nr:tripartite tricarboxylate transporter TctB family protein [Oceanispirochaeta crateris]QEN09672.1 tripartite tricarboxylate transporter TctB family protein [Oceanispirochaeta crateris]
MNEKQMRKADFISSIVLIIFGITVTWMAIKMPRLEEKGINPYTAPGVVPGILGVVILLLSLIMFVRTIRHSDFLPKIEKGNVKNLIKDEGTIRLMVSLALCLVYALVLVGNIPYVLATFLFVFGFILCFDMKFDKIEKSRKKIIIVAFIEAIISSAVISAAFQYLFLVDLP